MSLDYAALLEPIAPDAPSGADLDLTGGLLLFDSMRIFGQQLKPLGDLVPPTDAKEIGVQSSVRQYRWRDVLEQAGASLTVSKDIRVLAHAGAAVVRIDGMESFTRTLEVAVGWLDRFWESVYPRLDPDADARANALYSFSDKMAILDAVRRVPLAVHKQLGSCSFRDIERSWSGAKIDGQSPLDPGPVFAAVPVGDLIALESVLGRATAAIAAIEARMRTKTDNAAVPDLSGLAGLLDKIKAEIKRHLDPRLTATTPAPLPEVIGMAPESAPTPVVEASGVATLSAPPPEVIGMPAESAPTPVGEAMGMAAESAPTPVVEASGVAAKSAPPPAAPHALGTIRSRQDAIRALDAVAEFFRVNEPSSPVPLFVERSKRLISMSFLELLADVAPAAVSQAKAAAGLPGDKT